MSRLAGESKRGGWGLYGRIGACVVAAVVVCAGLLSLRQARLQAAHELTSARLRLISLDEELLAVRGEIAELSSPTALAEGPLKDEAAWFSAVEARLQADGRSGDSE